MRIKNKMINLILITLFLLGSSAMLVADEPKLSESNNVHIAPNAIGMPIGRILLIRKDDNFCAVKFTQCWTGKTDYEQHAEYESYYQEDKTGDFNKKNVTYTKEEVYYPKPSFSIFGHLVRIGAKRDICCGPIELWWSGLNCQLFVYYNKHNQSQQDYGFEFAPTIWTDISQVSVSDSHLKWYKYDTKRKDLTIPIDQLWPDKEIIDKTGGKK